MVIVVGFDCLLIVLVLLLFDYSYVDLHFVVVTLDVELLFSDLLWMPGLLIVSVWWFDILVVWYFVDWLLLWGSCWFDSFGLMRVVGYVWVLVVVWY